MRKIPPESLGKPRLKVQSSIWVDGVSFVDRKGKTITVDSLQEARDYAAANGYSGIIITKRRKP